MTRGRDQSYVGYCNPPQEHQFKKGETRPRRKRPPKPKNPLLQLHAVLSEQFTVTVQGAPQRMTLRKALAHALRQKALAGDRRAVRMYLEMEQQIAARKREPVDYTKSINRFLKLVEKRLDDAGFRPLSPERAATMSPLEVEEWNYAEAKRLTNQYAKDNPDG